MDSYISKIVVNINGTDIEFSSLQQLRELRDTLNEMLGSHYWVYNQYTIPYTGTVVSSGSSNPDCARGTNTA